MTATPIRQVYRPAPRVTAPSAPRLEETVDLPSPPQASGGLLLGMVGLLVAFATLPVAFSQPLLAVLMLLTGAALLVLMLTRHPQVAPDDADPLNVIGGAAQRLN